MSTPQDTPVAAPVVSQQPLAQAGAEVAVEVTDIKASGLPPKVGLFSGLFYVRVKGGKVPQRTRTARYIRGDDFVARWDDTVKLSGLASSKVEIEVFARRFFFSYKLIKKTESKESLADLLEHADSPIELELLEEGHAAGRLVFRISRSGGGGGSRIEVPPAPVPVPVDADADVEVPSPVSVSESPEEAA